MKQSPPPPPAPPSFDWTIYRINSAPVRVASSGLPPPTVADDFIDAAMRRGCAGRLDDSLDGSLDAPFPAVLTRKEAAAMLGVCVHTIIAITGRLGLPQWCAVPPGQRLGRCHPRLLLAAHIRPLRRQYRRAPAIPPPKPAPRQQQPSASNPHGIPSHLLPPPDAGGFWADEKTWVPPPAFLTPAGAIRRAEARALADAYWAAKGCPPPAPLA